MRVDYKSRAKLMGQLQKIIATFPDEVRLDQYPSWVTRIPESALEIHILLKQCKYKIEKQGVLDTSTIGLIQRRVIEIENELDGTISRSTDFAKPNSDSHYRHDLLQGLGLLFPLDEWNRFYSEIASISPPLSNN
jgi:hypothetical protein